VQEPEIFSGEVLAAIALKRAVELEERNRAMDPRACIEPYSRASGQERMSRVHS
jgi:hypothetical protein